MIDESSKSEEAVKLKTNRWHSLKLVHTKENITSVNYFTSEGISYRVSTLNSSFETDYHINLEKLKKRETVFLINGLTRCKEHWIGFDEWLATDVNVISIDPRGIGESRLAADWNHSVEDIVDDVQSVVKSLELSRIHLVGFSLGGMVALSYAMKHQNELSSLIVINSSIGGGVRALRLTPRSAFALLTAGLSSDNLIHTKLSKLLLAQNITQKVREKAVSTWINIDSRFGRGYATAIKQLFAAFKFRNPKVLESVSVPTLVVCGKKDKFVPPINSKIISDYIPKSKLVTFEKGGHELHMDSRDKLKKRIIDHVKANMNR